MMGLVQQIGQQGAAQAPPQGQAQGGQGMHRGVSDLKRFKDTGPTTFSGTGDSLQAEEWLRRTEMLLIATETSPARKVAIVSLELTDLARQWWASETDNIVEMPIPWDTFVDAFLLRFFTASEKAELQRRFLALIQGTNSVEAYNIEFSTLCRY